MTCDVWIDPAGEVRLIRVSGGPVANAIREAEGWYYLGELEIPLGANLKLVES